jgi:hypothetical protein
MSSYRGNSAAYSFNGTFHMQNYQRALGEKLAAEFNLPIATAPTQKRPYGEVAATIRALLADPTLAALADAEIARRVGCNRPYVGEVRRLSSFNLRPKHLPGDNHRICERGGTTFVMNISGITDGRRGS